MDEQLPQRNLSKKKKKENRTNPETLLKNTE